jgi:hypothetical protein
MESKVVERVAGCSQTMPYYFPSTVIYIDVLWEHAGRYTLWREHVITWQTSSPYDANIIRPTNHAVVNCDSFAVKLLLLRRSRHRDWLLDHALGAWGQVVSVIHGRDASCRD